MIILPVYATQELKPIILQSLASIKNTTDMPLCIVDDASPEKMEFEPTGEDIVVYNATNEGYTKTVNTGLKYALGTLKNVYIIGNDDLLFEDGQWEWVKDCKENTIVSPKTSDEGEGDMFGSIWAVHRTVVERIGLLNEKLKHFFSDTEYYHRAKRAGVTILKREDVVIEHLGTSTYKTLPHKGALYDHDHKVYKNMV